MVDFFDCIYFRIRPDLDCKYLVYPLFRFIIRIIANFSLKYYFQLTQNNKKYRIVFSQEKEQITIVSLTSIPERIDKLWMVIETILRQDEKPDRLILWLSKDEFKSIKKLPRKLRNQQSRGLEIRLFAENIRSHKKYFYALQEFEKDIIITIDDDVLYNSKIISTLKKLNLRYSKSVCCNHCSEIKIKDNKLLPYKTWGKGEISTPDFKIFPIGVGGVLYPPNSISKHAFNIDAIKSYCFYADDIWLNIMTKIIGNMAVSSNLETSYLPIRYKNKSTLTSMNVNQGLNDKQLEDVRKYCISKLGTDPFKYLFVSERLF